MFHNQFADWYRLATLTFTAEGLEKRSQGIEQIGKGLKNEEVLNIVRLSRGESVHSTALETTIDVFAQFDPTFPRRDNAIEMQVLASGIIAYLLKGNPTSRSDIAALATVTSDLIGLRRRTILPDFLEMAQTYLREEGDRVRTLSEIGSASTLPSKTMNLKDIKVAKETVTQSFGAASVNGLVDTLSAEITQHRADTSEFLSKLVSANTHLQGNVEILQEETNILWWLLGETSRDVDQRVSVLELAPAAMIIGKELADRTVLQPGPVSAKSLLNKMLSIGRKKLDNISLFEMTNSAPRDWRENWMPNVSGTALDLSPALFSVTKSLETDGNNDWLPMYEKAMGKNAKEKLPATSLAFQVYLECTLTNFF